MITAHATAELIRWRVPDSFARSLLKLSRESLADRLTIEFVFDFDESKLVYAYSDGSLFVELYTADSLLVTTGRAWHPCNSEGQYHTFEYDKEFDGYKCTMCSLRRA